MNTVDPDNFNETLDGYVEYALNFTVQKLKEKDYTSEQIAEIVRLFNNGIRWGKDGLTMQCARNYNKR